MLVNKIPSPNTLLLLKCLSSSGTTHFKSAGHVFPCATVASPVGEKFFSMVYRMQQQCFHFMVEMNRCRNQ